MTSAKSLITSSASRIAIYVVSLPLASFIFCIFYSLMYNFIETTQTHCKVANLLPSISAAIGNHSPQKYVWRIGVGIHSAPRFVYAWMYRRMHEAALPTRYRFVADIAFVLEVVEDSSLLGLTMVSSSENYPVHEKCFITFLLTSIAYMCLCAYIIPKLQHRYYRLDQNHQSQGHLATRSNTHADAHWSLMLKRRACGITLVCTVICVATFHRHNAYCEPYMYTFFAFAEYLIVLANMVFHATAYYDFYGVAIAVW